MLENAFVLPIPKSTVGIVRFLCTPFSIFVDCPLLKNDCTLQDLLEMRTTFSSFVTLDLYATISQLNTLMWSSLVFDSLYCHSIVRDWLLCCIAANLEVKDFDSTVCCCCSSRFETMCITIFLLVLYLELRRERLFWIECISFQIYNILYTQQACSIPRETANLSNDQEVA